MKILLASEDMTGRPEEGLRVYTMHLGRYLDKIGELTVLHAVGEPEAALRSRRILSPTFLLSDRLVRFLRIHRFDVALYVPVSGLTAYGLARGTLLRMLSKSPTVLIALQERSVGVLHRLFSAAGRPDVILSPVKELTRTLDSMGFRTGFTMPGFDEGLFRPVDPARKPFLRSKYGIPEERYIVLHVGHVREERNMGVFLRYREWGENVQVVVKAGDEEPSWRDRLRRAGVIVIDEYVESMHEIYQAADCYLFPVSCRTGALEFPLSVIEAAACNLPVLTTPFGALPGVIRGGEGFTYFENSSDIPRLVRALRASEVRTAEKVRDFSWGTVFDRFLLPHLREAAGSQR
jgi:glycosyltransferase involved in cell wall biosynthesis